MKVIALISQKGGVGKTTLTGHLAVETEAAGDGPVVLLDTDPQGSLAAWWNAREAETPAFANAQLSALPEQIVSLEKAGYAYAFIDTPPAMTREIAAVVAQADLVVIPVKPSPHDLRAVGSTVELVEEAGKPFLFVVTMAKAASRLTAQSIAALSAHGPVSPAILGDRVDFAASMVDGRTVRELDAKSRSAAETAALWQFVRDRIARPVRTKARNI
ncbi:MAG: ParA family protein [Rhodospirillaceae bacterium]|nr:ParA family protein [Rhodospirillaceae bacterium]